jgi:tRNA U34 5-carboxymethylaminomethyl modifying enzyme MnmG/GidA
MAGIMVLIPLTPYVAGVTISVVSGCALAFFVYQYKSYKYEQLNAYDNYLNQMKQEMKNFTECKDKQINNIYEILETLTNESKNKFNNIDESNSNDVKQVSL